MWFGTAAPMGQQWRSDDQQTFDTSVFRFVYDNRRTQVTLLLFGLRAGDVPQLRLIALYFPRAGYLESLLGTGVGLHLRHKKLFLKNGAQR
jgi:hypothetical protein